MHALIRRRRLALFVLIVGLQVALLLGVIFIEEGRQSGVEIVLESFPVDPRDPVRDRTTLAAPKDPNIDKARMSRSRVTSPIWMSRSSGDYVILGYRAERLDGLPGGRPRAGAEVYVVFEHLGRYWEPVSLRTQNLGADEWDRGLVAIRARVIDESPLRVEYPNLGEYFVPQGTGVLPSPPDVHVAVSRNGVARIKYLEVDGERWPRD